MGVEMALARAEPARIFDVSAIRLQAFGRASDRPDFDRQIRQGILEIGELPSAELGSTSSTEIPSSAA